MPDLLKPEALTKIRAKYPDYGDMTDADLSAKVLARYPDYRDLAAPGVPATKPEPTPAERKAYADAPPGTPEGAKVRQPLEAKYGAPAFHDPVANFAGKYVVPPLISAPLIAAGGEVAGVAGLPLWLGRMAGAGGFGALEAGAEGRSPGWGTILDVAVAGVTEGAGTLLTKALSKTGAPARAFEWATRAPQEALDLIRDRLPKGKWLSVPSLSSEKLSVEQAVKKLAQQTGQEYEIARGEIASELTRLDAQRLTAPKPTAGAVLKKFTSPERFEPSAVSKGAEAGARAVRSPAARTAADVLATEEVAPGVPAGALVGMAAKDKAADWAGHILRSLVP